MRLRKPNAAVDLRANVGTMDEPENGMLVAASGRPEPSNKLIVVCVLKWKLPVFFAELDTIIGRPETMGAMSRLVMLAVSTIGVSFSRSNTGTWAARTMSRFWLAIG